MQPYTTRTLEDGITSHDCPYCGQSFLTASAARRHYSADHKAKADRLAAYFRTLATPDFSLIWAGFVMRRVPKYERPRDHFQRVFLRDCFAKEVARRGL